MPDLRNYIIAPPGSPEIFENLVRDLFARCWNDEHAQRYGRSGQGQQGVDIVGKPSNLDGGYAGVQCKRYKTGTHMLRTIVEDVAKADKFTPRLSEYTIATSASRDAKLQKAVWSLNSQRESAGHFPIGLVFWEDILNMLSSPENIDLVAKYFPEVPTLPGTNRGGLSSTEYVRVSAAYRDYLRQQFNRVPLVGIAPRIQDRQLEIPLDDLFVPMQAEPDGDLVVGFVDGHAGLQRDMPKQESSQSVDLNAVMSSHRAVLLGEPGAGKSTCLRWILLQILATEETSAFSSDGVPDTLPVFIRLSYFAEALEDRPGLSLAEYLRVLHLQEYRALFATLTTESEGYLLLDGLDEIVDPGRRIKVRDAIESFAAQFPRYHVIVTSRLVGYRAAMLRGSFQRFMLKPFTSHSIATYAQNWYHAVVSDPLLASQRTRQLLRGMEENPRIRLLAGTPLLLAIIMLMDWKGLGFPRRRADLLEVATQTLLTDWPLEQGRPYEDADLSMKLLAPIAYETLATSMSQAIRRDRLYDLLIPLVDCFRGGSPWESRVFVKQWLDLLNEHSGILSETGTESTHPVFTFLHRSFAEYLAGRHLLDLWRGGKLDLETHTNDPRWHEPLLFMAAQLGRTTESPEATELVRAMLDLHPPHDDVLHQTLVLVAQCLAEDVHIAADLRSDILGSLVRFWHHNARGRLQSKVFRILSSMWDTESTGEILVRITPLLDDAPDLVRARSHELLGYIGHASDKVIRKALIRALMLDNLEVQRAAVRAMGTLGLASYPEARSALVDSLGHPDFRLRAAVVLAFGGVVEEDTEIRQRLCDTLINDEDANVRRMAVFALQSMRQPSQEVIDTMIKALIEHTSTRSEATACFRQWGQSACSILVQRLEEAIEVALPGQGPTLAQALIAIGHLGEPAFNLLSRLAQADHPLEFRLGAVTGLGLYPTADERVIEVLVRLVKAEEPAICNRVLKSLQRLRVRNKDVSLALLPGLEAINTSTRRITIETLAFCGTPDPETVSALKVALEDRDDLIRLAAADAAVRLGVLVSLAEAQLVAGLRSRTAHARQRSIESLQVIAGTLPRSVVFNLAAYTMKQNEKDPEVREKAIFFLGARGRTSDERLIGACRGAMADDDARVRLRAAEALGQMGDTSPQSIRALLNALADDDRKVRLEASTSLILMSEGTERAAIVAQVRALVDRHPDMGEAVDTLWGIIVGE